MKSMNRHMGKVTFDENEKGQAEALASSDDAEPVAGAPSRRGD
jgi:hypothetical protein